MTYALTTVNPFYAARLQRVASPARSRAARAAGLRPPAAGPDHRQPGAAPDQPLSLPPGRGLRQPELARQLRRPAYRRSAAATSARPGPRPDDRQRHRRRCVPGAGHPLHGACDIHQGFDACDPSGFPSGDTFDFIWAHPPYWRMKLYADDPRDLSRTRTLEDFLLRYGTFLRNCHDALTPGGKLAILMGDYNDREAGQVPLVYHTKRLAFAAGLRQHCTDIIRFSATATAAARNLPQQLHPRPARHLHDL